MWRPASLLPVASFAPDEQTAIGRIGASVRFNDNSALADLSEVNTDKITLAFALGPDVSKPMRPAKVTIGTIHMQRLTNPINSQLTRLQNTLR